MFKALSIPKLSSHLITVALLVAVSSTLWGATTGKIAGQVIDASTGEPIPGANVLIEGTSLGGATDVDGQYFVINVPPAIYTVRAEVIGYETIVQTNVRVFINLTTTVDFEPQVEAVAGQEVQVTAIRPVVQPDVSASVANVRAEEIEYIPVAGITEFINLQAGIEPGMRIRGAGVSSLGFVVDGSSMRDGRSNEPFSNISYTAIQEIQIQTGGFQAEYGNVRSGLINVVTKDPSRTGYNADVYLRYTPAQPMNFGGTPKDANAYYWRPYMDPDVAFVGTDNGPWDEYTQRQYMQFDGWNSIAGDPASPNYFLTATDFQKIFLHHTRKSVKIEDPEFDIDMTLGGPVVPGGGLSGLRFLASYRKTQDPYLYPQSRTVAATNTAQLKLLADVGPSMRVTVTALQGQESGMAHEASQTVENPLPQQGGIPSYPWSPRWNSMYGEGGGHVARSTIYGTDRYAITDVTRSQFGAALTHTLSPKTFYKVALNRMVSNYDSHPNTDRRASEANGGPPGGEGVLTDPFVNNGAAIDSIQFTRADTTGYYYLDVSPFGWSSAGRISPGSALRLDGHHARARDTSVVSITTLKFDLTNQTNRFSQLKAGVEIILSDFDMNYGSDDSVIVHITRSKQKWQRNTMQTALYAQNKLEFKGMIANVGLRLDYFSPGGEWWKYDVYERLFNAKGNKTNAKGNKTRDDELEKESTEAQVTLSPRIGVSFPITANSKLYFNYGHFRDILNQRELFQIETQWQGNVGNLGNPNHPLLKTVSYEVGYEQNILDQYLLRLTGYYNDRSNQPGNVEYNSIDGEVHYDVSQPRNYGDVRGVEITLGKTRGRWLRGFVNYTYMIEKSGDFGFRRQFENTVAMRNFLATDTEHYQSKPVANPFANADLEFIMPANLGPEMLGMQPLGDWHLNILGRWRAGEAFTWSGGGGGIPGLENNVRQKDFVGIDLRFSKSFDTGVGRAQFFVDITNVFNLKAMYFNSGNQQPFEFADNGVLDWNDYMWSLQLPKDAFADIDASLVPYIFIPGDDRPGDYRKAGVAFVPIEIRSTDEAVKGITFDYLESDRRVLGWAEDTKTYYEYNKDTALWDKASSSFVDQVLEDKAYIDMPNETYRTFLNPRKILFGLRVNF